MAQEKDSASGRGKGSREGKGNKGVSGDGLEVCFESAGEFTWKGSKEGTIIKGISRERRE